MTDLERLERLVNQATNILTRSYQNAPVSEQHTTLQIRGHHYEEAVSSIDKAIGVLTEVRTELKKIIFSADTSLPQNGIEEGHSGPPTETRQSERTMAEQAHNADDLRRRESATTWPQMIEQIHGYIAKHGKLTNSAKSAWGQDRFELGKLRAVTEDDGATVGVISEHTEARSTLGSMIINRGSIDDLRLLYYTIFEDTV